VPDEGTTDGDTVDGAPVHDGARALGRQVQLASGGASLVLDRLLE
jgi:hypothetical protein